MPCGRDQDDRAIARSQSATVSPLRISGCDWNNVRSQVCFAMSVHALVAIIQEELETCMPEVLSVRPFR